MESNMNEEIGKFCELLSMFLFCEEKLQEWKLSKKELEKVFYRLDSSKKGSLDIMDVFQNFPDLNQEELFHIYKILDFGRSGQITLEDLWHTVSFEHEQIGRNGNNPFPAFKLCIKIMQMNYQSIEAKKKQLGIDQPMLTRIFCSITESEHKKLEASQLISLLAKHTDDKSTKKTVLQFADKIFHGQFMTLHQFIEYFRPFSWSQIVKSLQDDSKKSLLNEVKVDKKVTNNPYSYNRPIEISYQRELNHGIYPQQQFYETKQNDQVKYQRTCYLNNIQRRRDQLRKGSLEREKIIKNLLSQKEADSLLKFYHYHKEDNKLGFGETIDSQPYSVIKRSTLSQQMSYGLKDKDKKANITNNFERKDHGLTNSAHRGGFIFDKQNIIRRAQDLANRKIEQIERNARMKAMKRSRFNGQHFWPNH